MAWNKTPSIQTKKPTAPAYFKWLSAIGIAIFFLIYFLYTNTNNELSHQKKWVNIIIVVCPLLIITITFLCRLLVYIKKKGYYDFLEKEKLYADKQWEQWGSRSMSVLKSVLFLPQKITLPYMLKHQSQHTARYKIPQKIDYLSNEKSCCFYLLRTVQDKVIQLSNQSPFHIQYLTKKNVDLAKNELTSSWEKLFPNVDIPNFDITDTLSYGFIESAIKDNENIIELILIEQPYTQEQSAILSVIIITTDDIAKSHHLETIANIKRPMPIDTDENHQIAIDLFPEIQTESHNATHTFSDGKCPTSLFTALYQSDNTIMKISPNTLIDLEFFIGPTGEYSSWFNMALAVEFVSQYKKTSLTLSQEPNRMFIGTITPSQSI
ncbi:hypothetical protein [Providencia burhodogranariea]|uniref:Type VI secretion protein n=1 Tax=Providencia burhodogranariea DSM 19968 TaxID=1141662 RepID=K8WF97_9GAMM|nr:hypothetical protein OOA_15417 [Providencia burhodogranariea DSM 19968]